MLNGKKQRFSFFFGEMTLSFKFRTSVMKGKDLHNTNSCSPNVYGQYGDETFQHTVMLQLAYTADAEATRLV